MPSFNTASGRHCCNEIEGLPDSQEGRMFQYRKQ